MARVTARKIKKEPGIGGVWQSPRGYEISITGHGEVAFVFALNKGYHEYLGWTYVIYSTPEFGIPLVQAWRDPRFVAKGKHKLFEFTEEGKAAAKNECIARIKKFLKRR